MTTVTVVGAGNWGRNIVRTLAEIGALGGVVELDERLRAQIAQAHPDTPIYARIEDALAAGARAFAVATPVPTHHAVAKRLLEAGADVFVEKPLALHLKEAEDLLLSAQERDRILMVGHLLLYQPAISWIETFLREGRLGRLLSLHQERLNLGTVRKVENALWSLGVHDVAVALRLVGEEPERVVVVGQPALQREVEDDVHLHLRFASGVQAHLHVSWLWPEKRRRLTIVGTKGMLVYDETEQVVTLHRKTVAGDLRHDDAGAEVVFRGDGAPLRLEMEDLVACVRGRRRPVADAAGGVAVVKVLESATRALEGSR